MKSILVLCALLGMLVSAMHMCGKPQPPPLPDGAAPDLDSGAGPSCVAACKNVHDHVPACPEGQFADCADVCTNVMGSVGFKHPDLNGLMAAKSVDDVRAAGWSCKLDGG